MTGLGQRQIVLSASKVRLKPAVDNTGTVKRADLARSRHTFAVVACRIAMKQPEISCFAARGAPIAAVLLGKQTLENEILRESLDA